MHVCATLCLKAITFSTAAGVSSCTPMCVSVPTFGRSTIMCLANVSEAPGNVTVTAAGVASSPLEYEYDVRQLLVALAARPHDCNRAPPPSHPLTGPW